MREQLLHHLYEAAELEHNLMCTYLYAAFSLKQGTAEGLTAREAEATARWRREIIAVAVEEMGHLTAVWNLTSALGGSPHMGRGNFPIDPGPLPARVVVKLAPFNAATIQHFIYLERPEGSLEIDGAGFEVERLFTRAVGGARLTPMPCDYDTVGHFYGAVAEMIRAFAAAVGEEAAFAGNRLHQLGEEELTLSGAARVTCTASALKALDAIVREGEGAPSDLAGSHYQRFVAIREEFAELLAEHPRFEPAHPAATNPVLRKPPRPQGRVWIEAAAAAHTVDVANACYGLMLRLLAMAYQVPSPAAEKGLLVDLAVGLMRAMTPLAEHAARLPAGAANPACNAGVSFIALRSSALLPLGRPARTFVLERFDEIAMAAERLSVEQVGPRTSQAAKVLRVLRDRAHRELAFTAMTLPAPAAATQVVDSLAPSASTSTNAVESGAGADGVEVVEGTALTVLYQASRCIHARHCVTGAPDVFVANTPGQWIHPDRMPVERLVEIAHACPSGAIQYHRKDGARDEAPPPVNLVSVREAGPYALRGELSLRGIPAGTRLTLCRCGASRNKPFCDGSHQEAGFTASGEPATGILGKSTAMMDVRNGPLSIDPEMNGPLRLRGQIEIVSGTGRLVCRVSQAKLCRCGESATKPFCDGTHSRVGFSAD